MNEQGDEPTNAPANVTDGRFPKGTSGNPSGAQLQLTDTILGKIVESLRLGSFFADACVLAGVRPRTGREWLARGHKGETPFDNFADAIDLANAQCQAEGIRVILNAAASDPKHAALIFRLFALKFPKTWREHRSDEASEPEGQPHRPWMRRE